MPDVSILQSDIDVQIKESRIPGFFLTMSVIVLIISIGSYVGLFFYNASISDSLSQIEISIKNINLENTSSKVDEFNKIEGKLSILQTLRKNRTDINRIMSILATTVHPRVYYENASIDAEKGTIELSGFAASPGNLSKQVSIYSRSKNILKYEIKNVALVADGVSFNASLTIKNN